MVEEAKTSRRLPKIPHEIWAAGDPTSRVSTLLIRLGRRYNMDVWFNGILLHSAEREGSNAEQS